MLTKKIIKFNCFRQIQDTIHDGNGVITMTIVALVRSSIWLAANIDLCQSTFELWSRWLIQHSFIILRHHGDTAAIHRSWTWLLFNASFLDLGQVTGRQFLQCHGNFFGTLAGHGRGQFRACTGAHDWRRLMGCGGMREMRLRSLRLLSRWKWIKVLQIMQVTSGPWCFPF